MILLSSFTSENITCYFITSCWISSNTVFAQLIDHTIFSYKWQIHLLVWLRAEPLVSLLLVEGIIMFAALLFHIAGWPTNVSLKILYACSKGIFYFCVLVFDFLLLFFAWFWYKIVVFHKIRVGDVSFIFWKDDGYLMLFLLRMFSAIA